MNLDSFVGSPAPRARLRQALAAGRLFHAQLICGEEGCGAGYFARLLAADWLQTDPAAADGAARAARVLAGTEADCLQLRGEGASGQIRVERVRDMRAAARETSLGGERRAVILYGAQGLGAAAANALLKILEEPPTGVLFLITAHSAAAVPATVRSRCSCVQLAPPARDEAAAALRAHGLPAQEAAWLAAVWQGRIGAALACAGGERRALLAAAQQACEALAAGNAYALMGLLAPYEKEREALRTVLGDTVQLLRSGLDAPAPPAGVALPAAAAAAAIGAVQDALARLRANGNARLVLTQMCLRLGA